MREHRLLCDHAPASSGGSGACAASANFDGTTGACPPHGSAVHPRGGAARWRMWLRLALPFAATCDCGAALSERVRLPTVASAGRTLFLALGRCSGPRCPSPALAPEWRPQRPAGAAGAAAVRDVAAARRDVGPVGGVEGARFGGSARAEVRGTLRVAAADGHQRWSRQRLRTEVVHGPEFRVRSWASAAGGRWRGASFPLMTCRPRAVQAH
mmetsp:Transcript_121466/g.388530  ORF Transcript_121466/g.388530 Transcript_121466/m.388530 type:complete len:212 (-) Transcript_121466:96-731(-)